MLLNKVVYPQSDGSLAMAFDEYISMHLKCLSICAHGYTFFLQQSALIAMVIDGKCYLGFQLKSNMLNISFAIGMFSN